MSDGRLSPKPDRQTGEPRPPRAPVKTPSNEKPQPWHPRKVPRPPEGEGPVLEWSYGGIHTQVGMFLIMAAILIVFMTFKGSGFGWMGDWRQWLIVGVVSLIAALIPRGMRVSAGADWVAHRRNEFAKTYELASIKFEKDWGEGLLDIDDIHGSGVRVGLGVLRTNQDLWDLVYNGIRHSVANGAEVNDLAIQRLRLYDVVAMRDAARGYRAPGGPHPF